MDSARLKKSSMMLKRSVTSTDVSGNNTTGGQLASTLTFSQFVFKEENLQISGNAELLQNETVSKADDPVEQALARLNARRDISRSPVSKRNSAVSEFQKMHEMFIQNILDLLFRRRPLKECTDSSVASESSSEALSVNSESFRLIATKTEIEFTYEESEFTTFNATGMVRTQDGREIDINLDISMSSRFTQSYSEYVVGLSNALVDPLVINLKDAPAGLTDLKFFFDLDADGELDEISQLTEGSGFLALDKNGDGVINDGSELFGTQSGDGFKDLSMYDEDNNGFIDENDSIFEKLKIFTKDLDGNDILYTLKEAGVGAIGLESRGTEFTLGSALGAGVNGVVRRTGIFLYENGNVGTIQHLDLAT